MVLIIMLYMVVLCFESVDEILGCDHSNIGLISKSGFYGISTSGTQHYSTQSCLRKKMFYSIGYI